MYTKSGSSVLLTTEYSALIQVTGLYTITRFCVKLVMSTETYEKNQTKLKNTCTLRFYNTLEETLLLVASRVLAQDVYTAGFFEALPVNTTLCSYGCVKSLIPARSQYALPGHNRMTVVVL